MDILVNGVSAKLDKRGCRHLGALFEKLQTNLITDQQVLVSFLVNGAEHVESTPEELCLIPSKEVKQLEVETATPRELALKSLADVQEYMARVLVALNTAADTIFSKEHSQESMGTFHDVVKLFDGWVFPVLMKVAELYQIDLSTIVVEGKHLLTEIDHFILHVEHGVDALERSAYEEFSVLLREHLSGSVTMIREAFIELYQIVYNSGR